VAAVAGVPTAPFALVSSAADATRVQLPFPLLAKPVAEGTGKGVTPRSIVANHDELAAVATELLDRYRQPVLVETFLPGREFTVGLIGTDATAHAIGSLEIVLRGEAEAGVYSYLNKEQCETLVEYRYVTSADPIVAHAERIALQAWRALGCRDGGRVDIRCDRHGTPTFLEANPLAGLHPTHSDLPMIATAIGMPYRDLIGGIIASAVARVPTARIRAA
jgi:D-alanine-D-alanine ligase